MFKRLSPLKKGCSFRFQISRHPYVHQYAASQEEVKPDKVFVFASMQVNGSSLGILAHRTSEDEQGV